MKKEQEKYMKNRENNLNYICQEYLCISPFVTLNLLCKLTVGIITFWFHIN